MRVQWTITVQATVYPDDEDAEPQLLSQRWMLGASEEAFIIDNDLHSERARHLAEMCTYEVVMPMVHNIKNELRNHA